MDTTCLIGKTFSDVQISDCKQYLKFCQEGAPDIVYYTEGDCCSQTWINDVFGGANLIGREIASAEDVEMPRTDNGHYVVTQYYGIRFKSRPNQWGDTTDALLVFRNESNGYYGGNLVLPSEYGFQKLEAGTTWTSLGKIDDEN